MKFSILLPTRNRLELLTFAVQSVLDQDYPDWEIVVSDNASDDDVRGFLGEVADPRIRYVRSNTLLPVTENWNRALDNSSGDYVVMLGDDDCLLQGCLSTASKVLFDHGDPDVLYAEAVQFAYPMVIPGKAEGFVQFGYCEFLHGETQPFWLPRGEALRMVRKSLGFQIAFSFNMQHSIFSRRIVDRLRDKGPFFQSPYPDYYATNALFLAVEHVLVCPLPLVAIGISPKSFGFFYFNQREGEGVDFLQNVPEQQLAARVQSAVLPGTNMNTSWLLAMEALKMNFGSEFAIEVAVRKYRFMQFRVLFEVMRPITRFARTIWKLGTPGERLFWFGFLGFAAVSRLLGGQISGLLIKRVLDTIHVSHPVFDSQQRIVPYQNILELEQAESPWTLQGFRAPRAQGEVRNSS
jgi:glycosyltransferase involved in cell wall biosynthesis